VRVRATFEVELAAEVGADGLGGGLEAKSGSSRREIGGVHALVTRLLGSDVLLLRDQVVNTLFKFHLNQL